MSRELDYRLCPGEQAMAAEIVARGMVTRPQLERTLEAVAAGRLEGPLNRALYSQRLIDMARCEQLEEYLHKHLVFGDFTVERRIGAGAMGDVYLARHGQTEERVALKAINKRFADDEQFTRRFQREISILTGIAHPNVARAVAFGAADGGSPYLALEYVPGPNLATLLDRHGPLPARYVLNIAIQVAQGLDHIYQETGLVHRDIKPENILTIPDPEREDLFDRSDQAKLIDFGLARSYDSDERLTMTGVTMGTPHYMSPEQIRGSQEVDFRSDIYSLAATMYHLLTGSTPFQGQSPGEVMTAHLTQDVPDPAAIVPSLDLSISRTLMTAMAKEPADRFLSYAGFIKACEDALGTGTGSGVKLLRKPLVLSRPRPGRNNGHKGTTSRARADGRPKPRPTESVPSQQPPGSYARVRTPPPEYDPMPDPASPEWQTTRRLSSGARTQPQPSTEYDRQAPMVRPSSTIRERDRLADAERIERERSRDPGIGLMPILILGAAVIALLAVVSWRWLL